ncbi:hypothetical protein EV644_1497 [Kribbella orskensis]|uniref:Uncharacterized protein n=1 Tax=Kribbella orskensis TaxID=2512216 RepID=A0ABY2B860_9ACTN|nr:MULTISPECIES: hypothetical protein [Kribbella]TCN28356.1 hypothetical protein EV642_1517 [Kribbella sp. VKM Ac-2500]TCO08098.1 hypothetical protein EV644_1497 [Kribbella orskensis]
MAKLDRYHTCLRFAYDVLAVRADHSNDLAAVNVGIWKDWEATGDVTTLPGPGIVQPSYTTRTASNAPTATREPRHRPEIFLRQTQTGTPEASWPARKTAGPAAAPTI